MNLEKICLIGLDAICLVLVIAAIAIRMGIMNNPYSQKDIQVAALASLALVTSIMFHRLVEKN